MYRIIYQNVIDEIAKAQNEDDTLPFVVSLQAEICRVHLGIGQMVRGKAE
jgi:hypothetical protein